LIEALIEWAAVKSISFRSINHPSSREVIQHVNPDFSVPMYITIGPHVKRLADVYDNYVGIKRKAIVL
jgi:hypothetical protein